MIFCFLLAMSVPSWAVGETASPAVTDHFTDGAGGASRRRARRSAARIPFPPPLHPGHRAAVPLERPAADVAQCLVWSALRARLTRGTFLSGQPPKVTEAQDQIDRQP